MISWEYAQYKDLIAGHADAAAASASRFLSCRRTPRRMLTVGSYLPASSRRLMIADILCHLLVTHDKRYCCILDAPLHIRTHDVGTLLDIMGSRFLAHWTHRGHGLDALLTWPSFSLCFRRTLNANRRSLRSSGRFRRRGRRLSWGLGVGDNLQRLYSTGGSQRRSLRGCWSRRRWR